MTDISQLELVSESSMETERIGEQLGSNLRGGELIELASDLGGGKTTLVRGIAKGAGSTDVVASPTFTISKVYQTKHLEIHHFDFYRLTEAGIMRDELAELAGDPELVVIVEWSDIVRDVLPDDRLILRIERTAKAEDARVLSLEYPQSLQYLVNGLRAA